MPGSCLRICEGGIYGRTVGAFSERVREDPGKGGDAGAFFEPLRKKRADPLDSQKRHGFLRNEFSGGRCFPAGNLFSGKAGRRVTILEKHGAPFFFHRTRKRKAFFLGFLLAASILYLLSSFIWNIQVTGNRLNSTQAVLEVLEREGIRHGQPKGKISCQRAADLLREEFENVVWVSARIQGTRLILEIKENTESFVEEKKGERIPSDLRATKEGTVVRIVTRSGVPKVKVGDSCEKGTVLISGQIPITDDSGEVVRTEEVVADGDVYIFLLFIIIRIGSRRYERRIMRKRRRISIFLQLFQWRLTLGGPFRMPETYDQITKSHILRLTENFILPVTVGRIKTLPDRTERWCVPTRN